MAAFDPSVLGILVFGLVAGICPCNSVLYPGLIGYLAGGKTDLTLVRGDHRGATGRRCSSSS